MKKLFYTATLVALSILAASCQRENLEPLDAQVVTYTVQLPDAIGTKAPGDGMTLHYEVYRTDAEKATDFTTGATLLYHKEEAFENGVVNLDLELVNNQNFTVLFWAQTNGNGAFVCDDLTKVTIDPTNLKANQENYAVFSGHDFIKSGEQLTGPEITLVRPVAQLNIATTAASLTSFNSPVTIDNSSVKLTGKLATSYNVATLAAGTAADVEFTYSAWEEPSDVFKAGYPYVAMNYVAFVDADGENVKVDYTIKTSVGDITNTIGNVPLKPNYRTNILGNLITETSDYEVSLEAVWGGADEEVEVITDGLVKINGVYNVSNANGLAYASQNLFAKEGGSYVLTEDIDMTGASSVVTKAAGLTYNSAALTHMMTSGQSFEFDGAGHVIKNLPGMFIAYTGSAKSVVVKNLTLETPNVAYNVNDDPDANGNKTDAVGAFIGYAGTSTTITLENCHVKGGKIEGGHWTGGLVGYAAGYSGNDGPVFETLTIKDCSVKNAVVTGKGSVGGIIGHATGDAWTLVDMDNITVTSNTISSTGDSKEKAGSVMGTLGIAGAPTTVNGVTKTGGTTIDDYEVSGNRVESNKVANTKLWGRQAGGVLTLDGVKVEDFSSYTEPASEFIYENGVYTLQKITSSALTDILADAEANTYGDITVQLAEDQTLSWAAGPAGNGANKLAHNGKVTIKNGTLSVTGAGSFVVENELVLDGVTVVDNTAYYSENGETAWEFCYLELTAKGTYKNCVFENTIMVDGQEATFENCKFMGKSTNEANATGEYSVWVYNGTAKFVECDFYGARGMKVCDYYSGADVTAVEIDKCTFNDFSKKPGLAIDERQGTVVAVTINNSTFTDVQPGDQGLYIYETDNVVPAIKNSKVIVDGIEILAFDENGNRAVNVSNDAELAEAIKNADGNRSIILAAGTYSNDIKITVAEYGNNDDKPRDLIFKAAEGAEPVIAGTVTLGYRDQGKGATMWNGNVTFEGIIFNHAVAESHSFDVQDVTSLTLKNCKLIGDGEYGLTSARGNGTGTSSIVGCTFENAGMQLLGNFATGLVIDGCTFNESRINVQAGNGVTVQNCSFTNTLTSANVNDSFYLIRSNSTPITVKECNIAIDSELDEVAASQAKWGILWNRGTTNWTVENVAVTMTEAAMKQTELYVTKCTPSGVINTKNLTVNSKAYASTAAQLTSAVNNGATDIYVQGEFKMPSSTTTKTITISPLNGNATIDNTLGSYWENATLTFNNVNFKTSAGYANGNGSDYAALYSKNVTYNKCNFSGPMRLGRDGAKFIDCTFNDLGNDYVWTYGNAASFTGCTFNSAGKALLIYSDGGNGAPAVSVSGCTFNATTGAKAGAISNQNCAAIEIHNYGYGVTLTTADNTVDTADGKFSGEWRIKTYETRNADSKIFVNGTEYTTLALDGMTMTIAGTVVTVQ